MAAILKTAQIKRTIVFNNLKYLLIIVPLSIGGLALAMEQFATSSSSALSLTSPSQSLITLSFKDDKDEIDMLGADQAMGNAPLKNKMRTLTEDHTRKLHTLSTLINDIPAELVQSSNNIIPIYSLKASDFDQFSPFIDRLYQLQISNEQDKQNKIKQKNEFEKELKQRSLAQKLSMLKVADYFMVSFPEDIVMKDIAQQAKTSEQLKLFACNNQAWQDQYENIIGRYWLEQGIAQYIVQPHRHHFLEAPYIDGWINEAGFVPDFLCLSPDKSKVAFLTAEHNFYIFDESTQRQHTLCNISNMDSVLWSHNSKMFAYQPDDSAICIWNGSTDQLYIADSASSVKSFAWSPNDQMLASARNNNMIQIVDIAIEQILLTLEGHSGSINSIKWSPDGKKIASGSDDGTIRIWDSITGRLLRTLNGNTQIKAIKWSSDGTMIAGQLKDGAIYIWYSATGKLLQVLNNECSWNKWAWSPDGKMIAYLSWYSICIWDIMSAQLLHTIAPLDLYSHSLKWFADGSMLIKNELTYIHDERSLFKDRFSMSYRSWDASPLITVMDDLRRIDLQQSLCIRYLLSVSEKIVHNHGAMKAIYNTLPEFIKNNSMLAKKMNSIYELTPENTRMLQAISTLFNDIPIEQIQSSVGIFTNDYLKKDYFDKFLPFIEKVYQLKIASDHNDYAETKKMRREIINAKTNELNWCWQSDILKVAEYLGVSILENVLRKKVYPSKESHKEKPQKAEATKCMSDHNYSNRNIAPAPPVKSYRLALLSLPPIIGYAIFHAIKKIKLSTSNKIDNESMNSKIGQTLSILGDIAADIKSCEIKKNFSGLEKEGAICASGNSGRSLVPYYIAALLALSSKFYNSGRTDIKITSLAWSPDSSKIAIGLTNNTICIKDIATKKLLYVFKGHTDWVNSVAWSSCGKMIASGSRDKNICIWDSTTGQLLQTLTGHNQSVLSVAWSHNNTMIASGSGDKTIRIWDASIGKSLRTFKGHTSSVRAVAWSPDDLMLASGSGDKTIRIWDSRTGELLQNLKGHTDSVFSVAWSSCGKMIVSGSADKTLRVWNSIAGQLIQTIQGHTASVFSVAWSHDDKIITSGSGDNTICLWHGYTGKLLRTLKKHTSSVRAVVWSPDDRMLVGGSWDHLSYFPINQSSA